MEQYAIRYVFPALVFSAFLSGCASPPPSIYSRESYDSYESQVYAYLKGKSREAQIEAMERDREKIAASGKTALPGYYAHLGLLYAETGDSGKAATCFATEKAHFPEAAPYMDFFLKKYEKKGEKDRKGDSDGKDAKNKKEGGAP